MPRRDTLPNERATSSDIIRGLCVWCGAENSMEFDGDVERRKETKPDTIAQMVSVPDRAADRSAGHAIE